MNTVEKQFSLIREASKANSCQLLIVATVSLLCGCAPYGSHDYNAPYASPATVWPNAYGLGVNADQYGRPHTYQLQDGQQLDPTFQDGVKRNAYGLGVHQDQFGRPVYDSPAR